jgi:hypothetical protein
MHPIFCTTEDVDLLWRARGLQALNNLENLTKKYNKSLWLETAIEYAFALHSSNKNNVHKIDSGLDFYKIILKADNSQLFCFNYIYDHKSGALIGVKIELLPKGWQIIVSPAYPNKIIVDIPKNDNKVFFDTNNPFDIYISKL